MWKKPIRIQIFLIEKFITSDLDNDTFFGFRVEKIDYLYFNLHMEIGNVMDFFLYKNNYSIEKVYFIFIVVNSFQSNVNQTYQITANFQTIFNI